MFSYDLITNPEVWKTFMSFEEMMNATQIPEAILKEMPTDTLVALCMNHPLAENYIYYKNHLEGAKVIIEDFNGFSELQKRVDASQKILDYYENYDLTYDRNNGERNPYACHRLLLKPINIGFIELVIASKEFSELYSAKYIEELERITNSKLEQKLSNQNYVVVPVLSKSLLIVAQIKLEKMQNANNLDIKKLKQFVDVGGRADNPENINEISQIIYSK